MKNIKYQIDNSFENIDKIRKIIYKTIQIIPNPYIFVSYSKYDDEDLKSIEEQHLKNNMNWKQSEIDVGEQIPNYSNQKSYLNGQEIPYGSK